MQIVISKPQQIVQKHRTITIEQYEKRRVQRRRRVSKRMLKRFPLFAVEEMKAEFPNMTQELFIADVTRKTRKGKSFRKIKSPMIREGRYWEMQKNLSQYHETGNIKFLETAQRLRNNMYLPFQIDFKLKGQVETWFLPSHCPLSLVRDLAATKFKSWEELEDIWKEKTRYGFR